MTPAPPPSKGAVWRLAIIVPMLAAAVAARGVAQPPSVRADAGRQCVRPAPRSVNVGDVVVADAARIPCVFVVAETKTRLSSAGIGAVAEIQRVVHAPDGRFYTHGNDAEIAVWSSSGEFQRTIGQEGQGPGELARFGKSIHFDPNGRMFVRDGNYRWTLFSASGAFIETLSSVGMGHDVRHGTFLSNGLFLTSEPPPNAYDEYFHIYDFSVRRPITTRGGDALGGPARVQSFGVVPEGDRTPRRAVQLRYLAYTDGTTFWAGGQPGTADATTIERWRTDGVRLITIRRDAAWLKSAAVVTRTDGREAASRPVTQIVELQDLGQSLLLVVFLVPKSLDGVHAPATPSRQPTLREQPADLYAEVIDTRAAAVLASTGPLARTKMVELLGHGRLSGNRRFKLSQAPDGSDLVDIVEIRVARR